MNKIFYTLLSFVVALSLSVGLSAQVNYTITGTDAPDNGWDGGGFLTVTVGANAPVDYTVAAGASPTTWNFSANDGDVVLVQYTDGSFDGDNEFMIVDDATGSIVCTAELDGFDGNDATIQDVFSFTALEVDPLASCTHIFSLTDSFGDGWNNSSLTVTVDGNNFAFNTLETITNATTFDFELVVPHNAAITAICNQDGAFPGEVSYTIADGAGIQVVNNPATVADNTTDAFTAFCPLPCTLDLLTTQEEYLLQGGECEAIINLEIEAAGFCNLLDEANAISGFVGPFSEDAINFSQADCNTMSETVVELLSATGNAPCNLISSLYEWTVPSNGVITFDYTITNPVAGHFFGVSQNASDNVLTWAWSATSTTIVASAAGSGSYTHNVVAGENFGLNAYVTLPFAITAGMNVEVSNFVFTPFVILDEGTFDVNVLAPVGPSTVEYCVTEEDGNEICVTLDVNVTAYTPTSNTISCNDNVQVSLDENCEAFISADMFLEGNDYSCYLNDYNVYIEGLVGNVNNTSQNLNLGTYNVTVENSAGVPCWGTMTVEDKIAPILECDCPVGGDIPFGAAMDEFSGVLETGDLTTAFAFACQDFGSGFLPTGGAKFFDQEAFRVSVDGSYTFTGTSSWGDGHLVIYSVPLATNGDVCANIVDGDDDSGAGFDPLLTTNLVAGVDYWMVFTSWGAPGTPGTWDVQFCW